MKESFINPIKEQQFKTDKQEQLKEHLKNAKDWEKLENEKQYLSKLEKK